MLTGNKFDDDGWAVVGGTNKQGQWHGISGKKGIRGRSRRLVSLLPPAKLVDVVVDTVVILSCVDLIKLLSFRMDGGVELK